MGHGNAAVRHHDHQIPQTQLEAREPGDAQDDDLSVEVSFKHSLDRVEPLPSSSSLDDGVFAPEPAR